MGPLHEHRIVLTRRHFFGRTSAGIGMAALATLLGSERNSRANGPGESADGLPGLPHFPPTARRVISLFQSGAPSQMDLFDFKPRLNDLRATELPDSIRMGRRLTGMTSRQQSFPVAPSKFRFARHGQSGACVSELLPYTARVVDELCFIRSMYTE